MIFLQFARQGGTGFAKPATGEFHWQLSPNMPALKVKKLSKVPMAFSQKPFFLPVQANDPSFAKSMKFDILHSLHLRIHVVAS